MYLLRSVLLFPEKNLPYQTPEPQLWLSVRMYTCLKHSSAAHPVLPALLVRSAASAGCGSYSPAGFAGLPLLRAQRVRGRCLLRFLPLQEWGGCSGTHSPYGSTHHPCQPLAPGGNETGENFLGIRAEFSANQMNTLRSSGVTPRGDTRQV